MQVALHESAAGPHVGDVRDPSGDAIDVVKRQLDADFVGDRRQVQRRVRRTADGDDDRDRVRERLSGQDVARADVPLQQRHHAAAGPAAELHALAGDGGHRSAERQRDAQRLAGAGHRVRGVHAAARAFARAGCALQFVLLGLRHAAGLDGADALEDVLHRHVLVVPPARHDRAAVDEH